MLTDDTKFQFSLTFVLRETLDQPDTARILRQLDLELKEGEVWTAAGRWNRVMVTRLYDGPTKLLSRHMLAKKDALEASGMEVLRMKAHTVSWHPAAVMGEVLTADDAAETPLNPDPYFQATVGFHHPIQDRILALSHDHGLQLCRDGRYGLENGMVHVVMRRSRRTHDQRSFHRRVGDVMRDAAERGMSLQATLPSATYTIADSDPMMDGFWFNAPASYPPIVAVSSDPLEQAPWPRVTTHPDFALPPGPGGLRLVGKP